jgi:hypothetical protein
LGLTNHGISAQQKALPLAAIMNPEQEIVSHEYWQQNAERLLYSASTLLEKLRTIQDDQDLEQDVLIGITI